MKTTGIILAGGKSSRMGTDKGLIQLNGKTMIEHIIENLASLDIPIIIVSNNPVYEKFGLPVYPDKIKDKGPVGGIYTGLLHSETEHNIVLSCDVPFVSKGLLTHLIENAAKHAVVIPKLRDKIHPLIGVYKKSTLETFKEHLQRDQRKLIKVCNELNSLVLDLGQHPTLNDPHLFSNVNTKEDLNKAQA